MRPATQKIARFGLLTALALVLGLMDRAIPLSVILGGALPGIKLGLANTVLLYAVYLMDWKSSVLLMLTKVLLSGLIYGSLSAIWFSLAGGALSLLVMLLIRKNPARGAVIMGVLAVAAEIALLAGHPNPKGQVLLFTSLIAVGAAACFALFASGYIPYEFNCTPIRLMSAPSISQQQKEHPSPNVMPVK